MYTFDILILINQRLMNVTFSTTKVLNGQDWKFSQNFYSLQCYLENPASPCVCFPLLCTPFLFQTLQNFIWLHSSWDFIACQLIKYDGYSKLVGINQMKLFI